MNDNTTANVGESARAEHGPLLTEGQLERYAGQLNLEQVGLEGQRKLLEANVLCVGAGGLGSPAALYLAAAGVGTIGIVDGDRVELSNLHRQILHTTDDVGSRKTSSARGRLEAANPDVKVRLHEAFISSENAMDILSGYDLVVNGSDNFPTRYLINDACVIAGIPLVDASLFRWEAQCTVFAPGSGCYRCLFPEPPPPGAVPGCAEAGVTGALAGHMGTRQALEAIKLILGIGKPLTNRLLIFDALDGEYRELAWKRNAECPVCGDSPTITELIDYEAFCGVGAQGGDGVAQDAVAGAGVARDAAGHPGAAPDGAGVAGAGVARDAAGHPGAAPDGAGVARHEVAQNAGGHHGSARAGGPSAARSVKAIVEERGWTLSAAQAADRIADPRVQWIDVREPGEYRDAHIRSAVLIPKREIGARAADLDPGRETVLVCHSGARSAEVTLLLRQRGFEKAYNLSGGMIAWMNARYPVDRE